MLQRGSALAVALARRSKQKTFAAWRTLEAGPHFGETEAKLCHGTAQRVAMDAQLVRRFTLVAPVRHQHLAQVLSFELANGILVTDAAGMHLCHQVVQLSSHVDPLPY